MAGVKAVIASTRVRVGLRLLGVASTAAVTVVLCSHVSAEVAFLYRVLLRQILQQYLAAWTTTSIGI